MFVYLCSFILLSGGQEPGRIFFLAQGAAQLRQRNVLQLANSLARHPEILAHVFQRLSSVFRFPPPRPKRCEMILFSR